MRGPTPPAVPRGDTGTTLFRTIPGAVGLCVVLLAAAPALGAQSPDGTARAGAPQSDSREGKALVHSTSDSLRIHLELPEEVEAGASVPFSLKVENVGDRPLDLYLTGRPVAFDLVVSDEEGTVLWRRLEGEIIAMVLRIETLAPGASLELSDEWDQRTAEGEAVSPGTYTVYGKILTEDEPLVSPKRSLRILP